MLADVDNTVKLILYPMNKFIRVAGAGRARSRIAVS
jgi:hypothetical protein